MLAIYKVNSFNYDSLKQYLSGDTNIPSSTSSTVTIMFDIVGTQEKV